MAGAPLGNQNAAQGKLWNAAIRRALSNRSRLAGKEALDDLAEKLLALAEGGDLGALKELGDRLDGKASQGVVLAGDADSPVITKVIREIVDPVADSNGKGV